ncbi:hypothetical protein C8Q76DRAFT_245649 [Earliella scabrosa]|nr:hypothetical protein C8Q76DRAFT_245649 [Earliella scabrosa]
MLTNRSSSCFSVLGLVCASHAGLSYYVTLQVSCSRSHYCTPCISTCLLRPPGLPQCQYAFPPLAPSRSSPAPALGCVVDRFLFPLLACSFPLGRSARSATSATVPCVQCVVADDTAMPSLARKGTCITLITSGTARTGLVAYSTTVGRVRKYDTTASSERGPRS